MSGGNTRFGYTSLPVFCTAQGEVRGRLSLRCDSTLRLPFGQAASLLGLHQRLFFCQAVESRRLRYSLKCVKKWTALDSKYLGCSESQRPHGTVRIEPVSDGHSHLDGQVERLCGEPGGETILHSGLVQPIGQAADRGIGRITLAVNNRVTGGEPSGIPYFDFIMIAGSVKVDDRIEQEITPQAMADSGYIKNPCRL